MNVWSRHLGGTFPDVCQFWNTPEFTHVSCRPCHHVTSNNFKFIFFPSFFCFHMRPAVREKHAQVIKRKTCLPLDGGVSPRGPCVQSVQPILDPSSPLVAWPSYLTYTPTLALGFNLCSWLPFEIFVSILRLARRHSACKMPPPPRLLPGFPFNRGRDQAPSGGRHTGTPLLCFYF